MAATHWVDNDIGYEQWVASHPNGFVANMNNPPRARYFVIHRASHNLPDRSNPGSANPRTGNAYSKVTGDTIDELLVWAKTELPSLTLMGERNYCRSCQPTILGSVETTPTSDFTEYVRQSNCLLARGKVARPAGIQVPEKSQAVATSYLRDPKVRAWVLQRANNHCELCGVLAPFLTADDAYFLEIHHMIMLAEGGPDTPINAGALCPNCHRAAHYAHNRLELSDKLKAIVSAKEDLGA